MTSRTFALAISLAVLATAATAWARYPWQGMPPYGLALMTEEERKTYWDEILALGSVEEKQAYWEAHIEKMQQRARSRGVAIPDPPVIRSEEERQVRRAGDPYYKEIMTREEQRAYIETLEVIEDPAERTAFIKAHVAKMRARALARGVSAPAPPLFDEAGEVEQAGAESEDDEAAIEVEGDDEQ